MKLFNKVISYIAPSNLPPSKSHIKLATAIFFPSLEAFFEIIAKFIGLCIVYLVFDMVGDKLIEGEFRSDTLLSLVVLPAIYILKDWHVVLKPCFIRVWRSDCDVTVESGILTKSLDCLNLKNVENLELTTTILGRILDYGTLSLYAYGSWVEVPYVKNVLDVKSKIDTSIKSTQNDKQEHNA